MPEYQEKSGRCSWPSGKVPTEDNDFKMVVAETEESCHSKCNAESYCKAWEFYSEIIENKYLEDSKNCKHWFFGLIVGDDTVGPNGEEFKCWVNNDWEEKDQVDT